MSDQPIMRDRGASLFHLPDQPLIGSSAPQKRRRQPRSKRTNPLLDYGEDLARARGVSAQEAPPPHVPTESSSLGQQTTIKRSLSLSGSPSPEKARVGDPPLTAPSASTSAAAPAVPLAFAVTTIGNNCALKQEPPALPATAKRRCLVDYSDSDNE